MGFLPGTTCAPHGALNSANYKPKRIMKKTLITTLTLAMAAPCMFANTESSPHDKSSSMNESTTDNRSWGGDHKDKDKMTSSGSYGDSDSHKVVSQEELDQKNTIQSILGAEVVDRSGEAIGTISDLALENGQIRDAFVSTGGVFGIGADVVQLPFDALQETQSGTEMTYRLDVQADEFTSQVEAEDASMIELSGGEQAQVVSRQDMEMMTTAKNTLDAPLVDESGQSIGQIADLGIEEDQVTAAYVELDRQVGTGDQLVRVEFSSLQSVQTDGEQSFRTNIPLEELTSALREASDEMDNMAATATGGTMGTMEGWSSGATASNEDEVERVQEQVDLILTSYEIGAEGSNSEVEVEQDGDAIVIKGKVASSRLEEHILENVRDISEKDIRDQLEVSDEVAMQ